MTTDPHRQAAIAAALDLIEPHTTISLGSGRAVFGLAAAIGERWPQGAPLRAVVASEQTYDLATKAGIPIVDLDEVATIDLAFDGADAVDSQLRMIKGMGAALLREKLVLAQASRVVIMVETPKMVERLSKKSLPVEIVRFGHRGTVTRLEQLSSQVIHRMGPDSNPLVTDEGNYLVDIAIGDTDVVQLAEQLKSTLGVIEHGLFLDQATEVLVGSDSGVERLLRTDIAPA